MKNAPKRYAALANKHTHTHTCCHTQAKIKVLAAGFYKVAYALLSRLLLLLLFGCAVCM